MPCDDSGSNASAASPTASHRVPALHSSTSLAAVIHWSGRSIASPVIRPLVCTVPWSCCSQWVWSSDCLSGSRSASVMNAMTTAAIGQPRGIPPAVPRRFDEGPIFLLLRNKRRTRRRPLSAGRCARVLRPAAELRCTHVPWHRRGTGPAIGTAVHRKHIQPARRLKHPGRRPSCAHGGGTSRRLPRQPKPACRRTLAGRRATRCHTDSR